MPPLIPAIVVAAMLLCAAFAPVLSPYDPKAISLAESGMAPFETLAHPLGTDVVGRDMLSRLIFGARNTALISLSSLAVGVVLGTLIGLIAGYRGGWVDTLLMRIVDAFLGFPSILAALVVVTVLGTGVQNVLIAISITIWPRIARMVRGDALANKERDYVTFAQAIGVPAHTIVRRHVFPQAINTLSITTSLLAAEVILLESSLAFLGLGFQPGAPAWGIMVAEGRQVILDMWWLSTLPGLAIVMVVMALTFLGDWLRDILDPQFGRVERSWLLGLPPAKGFNDQQLNGNAP
jgi:peptide/nickel transport system permease protein